MIFGDFGQYTKGDRGAGVWALESNLMNLGFYKGALDAIYGTGLYNAVRDFQAAANIDITGDADEGTLIALSEALLAKGITPMDPSYYRPPTSSSAPATTRANPTTAPPVTTTTVKQAGLGTAGKVVAGLALAIAAYKIVSGR